METWLVCLSASLAVVASASTLYVTEQLGNLLNQNDLYFTADGLGGTWADAVLILSGLTLGCSLLYLLFLTVQSIRKRQVQMTGYALPLILAIVSAALQIHMIDFFRQTDWQPDPRPPMAGENFRMRGAFGTAVVSMASISLVSSGINFILSARQTLNTFRPAGRSLK